MSRSVRRSCIALLLVLFGLSTAYAQSTASISGVVRDSAGGIVPGVAVVIKNDSTGASTEVVSGEDGRYRAVALQAGSYTISAALAGFKTAIAKGVSLSVGQPMTITLTLEIGNLSETVTVMSSAELINTETATVASMLNSDQLTRLPTPTRNALNAVTFLPGVNTGDTNRNSTVNGLPESFVSITLDGVSNNDNYLRNSDGFFATVTPRQDAVEAVSVTLAAAGASNAAGAGSATMAFQTRSGTNRLTGSAYEYYRDPKLNTNYYFNRINGVAKNNLKLNQWGGRLGGPVVIPGLFNGRDKLFFFGHFEKIVIPFTFPRSRTVYNSRSMDGIFRYQCSTGTCEVNLLTLAAANGQTSVKDPTVASIFGLMNASMLTTGTRTANNDPLLDTYVWNSPAELNETQPTFRIDWNVTNAHRVSSSFAIVTAKRTPDYLNSADPRFPGAPNHRDFVSKRPVATLAVRSVLSKNITNELRGGVNSFLKGSNFGFPSAIDSGNAPSTFKDLGGYAPYVGNTNGYGNGTTAWFTSNSPSWRSAPTFSVDELVTWQRGRHTLTGGASWMLSKVTSGGENMVPAVQYGVDTNFDPANAMFTGSAGAANFPGLASTSAARNLYAVLTGRVTSIDTQWVVDPATGKFVENAPRELKGGFTQYSAYLQDSWKLSSTLTLTGGLRYDLQMPFKPSISSMTSVSMESACGVSGLGAGGEYTRCQFATPGVKSSVVPQFDQIKAGTLGYKTDYNNVGPSLSVAWRPNVQKGFLRALFGDPDQATFRAGYSIAYDRQGLATFDGIWPNNPGMTTSSTRNANVGNLVLAGESWPLLFSQTSRLGTAPLASLTPTYPIALRTGRQDSLTLFAPQIQIGMVQSWMIGFARSLGKDMAVELRYIGNYGTNEWSSLGYNTLRADALKKIGFTDEFKLMVANLKANNIAGGTRAGSVAYFGAGTGTSPLPIALAYLNGKTDTTNAASYTGSGWTSLAGNSVQTNPSVTGAAGTLVGSSTFLANGIAAGFAPNFFLLNPAANNVSVTDSGAKTGYNAFQVELRRRLSKGFSANMNYQLAYARGSGFEGFSFGRTMYPQTENALRHSIKLQADYQIPIGRGQSIGGGMSRLADAFAGGWSITVVGKAQRLTMDLGNVRLVGMTLKELQDMYKYYFKASTTTTSGLKEIWMLPDDVILNTRRAFSASTTTADGYASATGGLGVPTGRYIAPANSESCIQVRPGDCAPRSTVVNAPWNSRFDMAIIKRVNIVRRINIELRADVLNVFDNPNFNPVANPGSGATIFKVTSGYTDASNTYDPGGRIGQLMIRLNW